MIIPSAADIKVLDSTTIQNQHIEAADLMERAAKTVSNYLIQFNPHFRSYAVFCGTGNNGGDGLCISRHLLQHGYQVQVFICNLIETSGKSFLINYNRLKSQFPESLNLVTDKQLLPETECDCIIDALLGTGLNKPVSGLYADIINYINVQDAIILSVDIPSGLAADNYVEGPIVKADITISFEFPKLSFLFP
ncbi:MAG: NAD(P)H-hydrate epimerase [Chitinophagales bacterium]